MKVQIAWVIQNTLKDDLRFYKRNYQDNDLGTCRPIVTEAHPQIDHRSIYNNQMDVERDLAIIKKEYPAGQFKIGIIEIVTKINFVGFSSANG